MKSLLKHFSIPILASQPLAKLAAWLLGNSLPIFMLHRMHTGVHPYTGTSPRYLRQCLQYLVDNHYNFISLEDAILKLKNRQPIPHKSVAFTMDDGYWDQAEIAAPIFIEYECPVTLFVITGMLDNNLWPWDAKISYLIDVSAKENLELTLGGQKLQLSLVGRKNKNIAREVIRNIIKLQDGAETDDLVRLVSQATEQDIPSCPPKHFMPMSWDTARQLECDGIKLAPHTLSHRMLSRLDDDSSRNEIFGSWQRLKEELVAPSPVFCYPTGRQSDYSKREIELLKQGEFLGAVSTSQEPVRTPNRTSDYLFNLPRLSFPVAYDDFLQYCSWIESAKTRFRSYIKA